VNHKSVVACNQVDTIFVVGTAAVKTVVVVVASSVVDSRIEVAHNWFAVAIAVEVVAVAMVVAIAAVDIPGLVVAALFIPLSTLHHTQSIQCAYYYNATLLCE